MTPQEWIKDTLSRWPTGHHVAEGATHLTAALKEIAERDAEIIGHRDEIALLHAKLSDAEEEIARLRADAGRVVVPEGALYIDSAVMDSIMDTLRSIGDMAHNASTGPAVPDVFWDIRQIAYDAYLTADDSASEIVQATTPVPSSRVLKDGEVAIEKEEFAELLDLVALIQTDENALDHIEDAMDPILQRWEKRYPIRALGEMLDFRDALRTQATESGEKGGA